MDRERYIKALLALEDKRFAEVCKALKESSINLNHDLLRLRAAGLLKKPPVPMYVRTSVPPPPIRESTIRTLLALEDRRCSELYDALKSHPGDLNYHMLRLMQAGLLKTPDHIHVTYSRNIASVLTNDKPKTSLNQYK